MFHCSIKRSYVGVFCVFLVLLILRESSAFGYIFDLLPVLGDSAPYVVLAISIMYLNKQGSLSASAVGLRWPKRAKPAWSTILWIFFYALVTLIVTLVSGSLLMEAYDLLISPRSVIEARKSVLVGNTQLLFLLTPLMWGVVICEEVLFRGFLLNYLANKWGGTISSWVIAILISSMVFGLGHFWQGGRGIAGATMLGLLWATLYYRCGQNLWPPIVAHAAANTIGFISTYLSI